jgi:DNA-binding LacI/PurR family transcriptional regulator/anti-anti-sigma regulatory factor
MKGTKEVHQVKQNRPRHTRPTIGLLIEYVTGEGGYQAAVWAGVADAARAQGANLICFTGGTVGSVPFDEYGIQRNRIYDLVAPDNVDGLVISSGSLSTFVSAEEYEDFCDRYRSLPLVSIGLALEGIPSVLVDNVHGLRGVIDHLIEAHGCRRIAFVRGPKDHQEADLRYRTYTEVLAEHGLTLDSSLVAPGNFLYATGVAAIHSLLDDRSLRPGVDFDAIVASNDNMAIGAMDALRDRGTVVPRDVAVVGFDDLAEAPFVTPPLTTVRQPIYEQGKQAVEMLLALSAGKEVPEQVMLPTQMVARESCGCYSQTVLQAAVGPEVSHQRFDGETLAARLAAQREEIISEMVQAVPGSVGGWASETVSVWAERLLDGFVGGMEDGAVAAFLPALDETLRRTVERGGDVLVWQRAISVLHDSLMPYIEDDATLLRAEGLWHQARVMVGEAAQRVQAHQKFQVEQRAQTLTEVSQSLITAFDVDQLMDRLVAGLPWLEIPRCYLSMYEDDPPLSLEWARWTLAYEGGRRVELEAGGRRFPSVQLVPGGIPAGDESYRILVQPLWFQNDQIGFVLFEAGLEDGMVCETLGGSLSSALKGALLLEERRQAERALKEAYAEVEKRVEERTAELQREVAQRERLQQKVIEAQKVALQELSTPIIPVMERIIIVPLVGSIDSMRARDITRALLAGIRQQKAQVVILDITGVPIVDSGVADHLNKTIQAARLKGARTIVTGISDAVAETIVDLGIDWSGVETLSDLQRGLVVALGSLGIRLAT